MEKSQNLRASLLKKLSEKLPDEVQSLIGHYLTGSGALKLLKKEVGIPCIVLEHGDPVISVAFNRDGTRVVTVSGVNSWAGKIVKIWDAKTGHCLHTLEHDSPVHLAVFNNEGTQVVAASGKAAYIWGIEDDTCKCLHTLKHEGSVRSAVFNSASTSEGIQVVTGSADGTAKIWNAKTGVCLQALPHTGPVISAAFNREGTQVVAASYNGTAKIWDVAGDTCKCLHTLQHAGWVYSAAFNRDGTRVVTMCALRGDGTVKIWDVKTGHCLQTPRRTGQVISVAFNCDGTHVVTVTNDKTAQIWDVYFVDRVFRRLSFYQAFLIDEIYKVVSDPAKTLFNFKDYKAKNPAENIYEDLLVAYNELPAYIQQKLDTYVTGIEK